MSQDIPTQDRLIPKAKRPDIQGPFEMFMALGRCLPGRLGYIARRKLKRRHCKRAQDTFSQVLTETGVGDLCIDLGANIGTVTRRMAETGAKVISFEPDPGAWSVLKKNTEWLPNVRLINKAVGHEADTLTLYRSDKWSAYEPGAHTESSSLIPTTGASQAITVDVVDIIAFIEDLDRDIRIIKMDIEGAEWEILTRLIEHPVLNRIDCIFVETHERTDPAKYVPLFDMLQTRAEQLSKPYINLYWI